jgi:glyoxylase-like metal-dependent hydrolase (beta-lactamase superfamily II)
MHAPGHTLGSMVLVASGTLALTGDFVFVRSVGRPDLGGQRDAWTVRLWDSLERARREWPGDLLILPAHYADECERRADRSVAARFDVIAATNEAVAIREPDAFRTWIARHSSVPPDSYRTIKLANLGLVEVSDSDAEILEFGSNQCAVG